MPPTSGSVSVDGKSLSSTSHILALSTYVQQDDCMLATQTVRETVIMSALLRLPATMSHEEKVKRADDCIQLFGLNKCKDTYIGDGVKVIGVSGGERKRTSIAISIVAFPKIVFLDEPTSGLDSFIAFSVIKSLRRLCSAGVTVITTIHQPSSDTFALFDDLVLLADGSVVYHGESVTAVDYFARRGGFVCPPHSNPADFFFMHVLTCGDDDEKLRTKFVQSERSAFLVAAWGAEVEEGGLKPKQSDEVFVPLGKDEVQKRASTWEQFKLLFTRSFREATRNPMRVKAQFGQAIALSIIISSIWWQVKNSQQGIQDRNGVLFFMSANGMMTSMMGVLSTFGNERATFIRDYENNLYGVLSYFTAKIVCDLPFFVIFPFIQMTIMYFSVGFQTDAAKYINACIILVLLNFNGMAFGLILASFFADVAVALVVAPLFIMPLMMFSG